MALLLPYISALLAMVVFAPYSAGQNNTVITPATTAPLERCERITMDIPTCINVGWNNTSYPNLRSHQNQVEAYEELEDFDPLIQVRCSNKIVHFLCAVYAPVCLYSPSSETVVLKPCRSLCEYVRSDCEPQLNAVGYSWPSHFNCDNFAQRNPCVDVGDSVEIPHIPGLEVEVDSPTVVPSSITPTPAITATSSAPTVSPSLQPPPCEGFLDEGNCVESCNSQKYIVDNDGNVSPNPHYRVTFNNQCLRSCPEGYVEHMSQCNKECPQGFLSVNGVCEECIGDCDEDGPTQTLITVTSAPTSGTCEPITNDIPTCLNVGWPNTSYPNLQSHETQEDAYEELKDFNPLIRAECSNKIVHFLCAIYAPVCLYTTLTSSGVLVLPPCRSLCEYVRNDCESQLNAMGSAWPTSFSCDNFPQGGACLDVDDSVKIPPIVGLGQDSSSVTPSPARIATSSMLTLSPSLPVQPCEGFLDEGNCVKSCNSHKYIVDNDQNVFPNPDYRVTFYNHCLRSCPEGYVEHMAHCITSCPQGLLSVNGVCKECIGECPEELYSSDPIEMTVSGSTMNGAGLTVIGVMLAMTVELVTSFLS